MLKIHTEITKAEICTVLAETGFLAQTPTGFLFWFESPDLRTMAMEELSETFPGTTFDVIEHDDQETVESEKAVIDTPPPAEPENEKEYLNET